LGKVVVLAGLPGVGKTTLMNRLMELAKERGLRLGFVTYGTLMLQIAQKRGLVSDRDELKNLPLERQQELQLEASERIKALSSREGTLLVDTHMFIKTPRGRWPGISVANLGFLKPDQFLLVEEEAERILTRREKDSARRRNMSEIRGIEAELEYSRYMAAACSVMTGSPVERILNREGELDQAVERIIALIERVGDLDA